MGCDSPLTADAAVPGTEEHTGDWVQLVNVGMEAADLTGLALRLGSQSVALDRIRACDLSIGALGRTSRQRPLQGAGRPGARRPRRGVACGEARRRRGLATRRLVSRRPPETAVAALVIFGLESEKQGVWAGRRA